jgi:leucyl-tRNA synthetase
MDQNNREKAVELEKKWQEVWEKEGLYRADIGSGLPHFYNLWMFPYPSAEGLHAGHAFASTGSDVFGRFMRMKGREVFQPIGYDSFGIHSENYAIKIGQTPQQMLERTTANYERQMRSLGHGYDWTRTVTTSEPNYYKHTQWIFTTLFKSGLAYRKNARVNWCPSCKTVLSDEQVIDGACERCGTTVVHKNLTQWFFRITEYADKLLSGLDQIDWSQKVSSAQRQWIGKQEGFSIDFKLKNTDTSLSVWTKYWETVFGATFLVIAPEHPLLSQISIPQERKGFVDEYISTSLAKSEQERKAKTSKTGVDTGLLVINPVNGKEVPLWIADYVMMDVGTGVVMGVPAHDKRDYEFAKEYNLPVVKVVAPEEENQESGDFYEGPGRLTNSSQFDGQSSIVGGKLNMANWMVESGYGSFHIHYHLRDWLISRQRYWGAPIPMVYCENCAKNKISYFDKKEDLLRKDQSDWDHHGWYPVEDSMLPVLLPEIEDYKPKGEGTGPLADHPDFYSTTCPNCGGEAKRETDVCDTFLDSSWYFLRYPSVDATNSSDVAFDPAVTKSWLPVNLYFGGAEHSVLHLMYARFVTQVLFDLKLLGFSEPFPKFFAHGLMIKDGAKMSKSRGNVVNPDVYVEKFGADVMRLYLMFMGPMDGSPDFRDTGIEGMERFAKRLNGVMAIDTTSETTNGELVRLMHKTIKKVSEDMETFSYNTAIAAIMEFVNAIYERKSELGRDGKRVLCLLLAPFAPHLSEEWWRGHLGGTGSVHKAAWPEYEADKLVSDSVTITVQVNGKLRGQLTVSRADLDNEEQVLNMAKEIDQVKKYINGMEIKKQIYVKGRTVNLVV